MTERNSLADIGREMPVTRRDPARCDAYNEKKNILTLTSTNIHSANAHSMREHGTRAYIEVGVKASVQYTPTKIGYVNMEKGDVYSAVGQSQFEIHKNAELARKHPSKDTLVSSVISGAIDVGITRGTISNEIIPEGIMVFSPLYYNSEGKTRVPKKPVTIVARVPKGK